MATDAGAAGGGARKFERATVAERHTSLGKQLIDFHVTAVEVREVHDHFGMDIPATPPGVPSNTPWRLRA